jgi:hypothetical protein
MGPRYDDRTPQEEPTREPLVDLNVKPRQPGAPSAGLGLRRKRLSDREPKGEEAPAQKAPRGDLNAKPRQPGAPSARLSLRRKRSPDRESEGEEAPPRKESARQPLVDLTGKPPEPGDPSGGPNLRRKRLSNRGPEGEEAPPQKESARQPLVDLTGTPPQPGDPSGGSNLRRKRLSDRGPEGEEAPPQPQAGRQRRRALVPHEANSEEPPSEAESSPEPRRPRLVALAAAPEAEVPEGATPEAQEPQLKVGRARVTITQAAEDPAGLQNIIDPPRSLSVMLAPGQNEIVQPVVDRQNKPTPSAALVGGVGAALAAALVWALIAMVTGYHAGWMVIGVGLLVGGAVRTMARGGDKSFGYLGAAVSVVGCLLGSLLSACAFIAGQKSLAPLDALTYIYSNPAIIPGAMIATFQFLDLPFWAAGIYAAYRLSFRRIPPAETDSDESGQ